MVLLWRVVPSIGVCLHGWRQSTSAVGLPETPTRVFYKVQGGRMLLGLGLAGWPWLGTEGYSSGNKEHQATGYHGTPRRLPR